MLSNKLEFSVLARIATKTVEARKYSGKKHDYSSVSTELIEMMPPPLRDNYHGRWKREWVEETFELQYLPNFTILVVDDLPDQVKYACEALECYENVHTESAPGGLEAIRMIRQKMEQGFMYHLVLTDLWMPHNGFMTCQDIRELEKKKRTKPRYIIIGLSGEAAGPKVDEKAFKSEMDQVFQKPMNLSKAKQILERIILKLGLSLEIVQKPV